MGDDEWLLGNPVGSREFHQLLIDAARERIASSGRLLEPHEANALAQEVAMARPMPTMARDQADLTIRADKRVQVKIDRRTGVISGRLSIRGPAQREALKRFFASSLGDEMLDGAWAATLLAEAGFARKCEHATVSSTGSAWLQYGPLCGVIYDIERCDECGAERLIWSGIS